MAAELHSGIYVSDRRAIDSIVSSHNLSLLQQIKQLSHSTNTILNQLQLQTENISSKLSKCNTRISDYSTHTLPSVIAQLDVSTIVDGKLSQQATEYRQPNVSYEQLFTSSSRTARYNSVLNNCVALPDTTLIDQENFNSNNNNKSCQLYYSDPAYFIDDWLASEEVNLQVIEADRAARRAERKKLSAARSSKRNTLQASQVDILSRKYNKYGAEFSNNDNQQNHLTKQQALFQQKQSAYIQSQVPTQSINIYNNQYSQDDDINDKITTPLHIPISAPHISSVSCTQSSYNNTADISSNDDCDVTSNVDRQTSIPPLAPAITSSIHHDKPEQQTGLYDTNIDQSVQEIIAAPSVPSYQAIQSSPSQHDILPPPPPPPPPSMPYTDVVPDLPTYKPAPNVPIPPMITSQPSMIQPVTPLIPTSIVSTSIESFASAPVADQLPLPPVYHQPLIHDIPSPPPAPSLVIPPTINVLPSIPSTPSITTSSSIPSSISPPPALPITVINSVPTPPPAAVDIPPAMLTPPSIPSAPTDLLSAIRAGSKLKKVSDPPIIAADSSTTNNARSSLLDEIRTRSFALKSVHQNSAAESPPNTNTSALAQVTANPSVAAILARRAAIQGDDSSDDEW